MNPETIKNSIQAVIDGITPLAEKMKMPVEKLFEWAVRENYVVAISELFGLFVVIVFTVLDIFMFRWAWKNDNKEEKKDLVEIVLVVAIILGICLALAWLVYFVFGIPAILGRLINPEYHAFLDLLSKVK